MRLLWPVLIFVFATNVAIAQGALISSAQKTPEIKGAFGILLGEKVDNYIHLTFSKNKIQGTTSYWFKPTRKNPIFTEYYWRNTPLSEKIYEISAQVKIGTVSRKEYFMEKCGLKEFPTFFMRGKCIEIERTINDRCKAKLNLLADALENKYNKKLLSLPSNLYEYSITKSISSENGNIIRLFCSPRNNNDKREIFLVLQYIDNKVIEKLAHEKNIIHKQKLKNDGVDVGL